MAISIRRFFLNSLNPAYRLHKLKRRLRRLSCDRQYARLPDDVRQLEGILDDPRLKQLFSGTAPRLSGPYYYDYVSRRWPVSESIRQIHAHYRFVRDYFPDAWVKALAPGHLTLWQAEFPDLTAEVRLALFADQIHNEGELELCCYLDGQRTYTLSFNFHARPDGRNCALITRNQGVHTEFERVKRFQKAHFQVAPLFLVVDALVALCTRLGIDEIRVLAPDESYNTRLGAERLKARYIHAFESFNGLPADDGRLAIALPLQEKPLESLDRHHRKRTERKRLARERMRADVSERLAGLIAADCAPASNVIPLRRAA